MNIFAQVGKDTGQLTDEEMRFIDQEIIGAAWPALHAREIFDTKALGNAGLRTVRHYTQTDMSGAVVDENGEDVSLDRTVLTAADVKVPVIHKEFTINWRDILAARHNNQPLDVTEGQNAARQVAEEENFMLLTGETAAHPLLGIEGLMTATNRNTEAGGAWPANCIADVNDGIAELEADGHTGGPYVLLARVDQIRKLGGQLGTTGMTYKQFLLSNGLLDSIIADDSIFTAADATTSGMIVVPGRANFELAIGQDLTVWEYPLSNMNKLFRVFEVLTPHIKRPTALVELTGLS